jgi:putative ABC transport system substrate-binding protein
MHSTSDQCECSYKFKSESPVGRSVFLHTTQEMNRRTVFVIIPGYLLAWPLASTSQPKGRPRRIAFLSSGSVTSGRHLQDEFARVMRELGWIAGGNLIVDERYAEGDPVQAASATRELLALKPEVFVSTVDTYARTAAESDKSLPIVFILGFDPVGVGLVKSLASPESNATGFSILNFELNPKRLSLLKEAVPRLDRVGVLYRDGDPSAATALEMTRQAGRDLGVTVIPAPIQGPNDIAAAFQRLP